MTLQFSLACHDYAWTQPLWDGRVEPEGLNLNAVNYPNPVRFSRMVRNLEFDACELSMGTYLASRARAEEFPFTAIPVFPFRKFRQSYMYKREGAGIDSPADLEGRRVGIVNWQTTTGIWQRGILDDYHGVDTTAIDWVAAGTEIIDVNVPDAYDVEYLDVQGNTIWVLQEMLEDGDIDGIFHPVDADVAGGTRLFPDAEAVEQQFYRDRAVFPIMHAIVLKDSLLEDHPWVVQKLYDAFERAKAVGLEVLDRPRELPLVWADVYADTQREILGDDPWEYGLTENNVTTLETLVEYAHAQGVAAEEYDVGDLFYTETLDTPYYA